MVAPDGTCFDLAGQRALHQKFLNEKHILGDFELVQISDKPERGEDGKIRYVQYNSVFFANLPGSIAFDIS